MDRGAAIWMTIIASVGAFFVGLLLGWYVIANTDDGTTGSGTTRTETVTVEKTVPGPERTVVKKKPGVTTWIIVCGETTQKVTGNKPTTECKGTLPNTGP